MIPDIIRAATRDGSGAGCSGSLGGVITAQRPEEPERPTPAHTVQAARSYGIALVLQACPPGPPSPPPGGDYQDAGFRPDHTHTYGESDLGIRFGECDEGRNKGEHPTEEEIDEPDGPKEPSRYASQSR